MQVAQEPFDLKSVLDLQKQERNRSLSYSNLHDVLFNVIHFPMLLCTARRILLGSLSVPSLRLLFVWPGGKNSLWTIPLTSKTVLYMTDLWNFALLSSPSKISTDCFNIWFQACTQKSMILALSVIIIKKNFNLYYPSSSNLSCFLSQLTKVNTSTIS